MKRGNRGAKKREVQGSKVRERGARDVGVVRGAARIMWTAILLGSGWSERGRRRADDEDSSSVESRSRQMRRMTQERK